MCNHVYNAEDLQCMGIRSSDKKQSIKSFAKVYRYKYCTGKNLRFSTLQNVFLGLTTVSPAAFFKYMRDVLTHTSHVSAS